LNASGFAGARTRHGRLNETVAAIIDIANQNVWQSIWHVSHQTLVKELMTGCRGMFLSPVGLLRPAHRLHSFPNHCQYYLRTKHREFFMTINRFEILEEQTRILKEIATAFPQASSQYAAIQNATFALIFAISEDYESFIHFVDSSRKELSNEEKDNLRKLGIPI
jgi:hypothetical protein